MSDQQTPDGNQPQPNATSERLAEALRRLNMNQIRYCIARLDSRTDKEAAESIGLSASIVKSWDNKAEVDEAVRLMANDGVVTALEIRCRHLAEAMAVKVAGLESRDERVRQTTATEIIEWELGKAQNKTEVTGKDGGPVTLKVVKGVSVDDI